MKKLISLVLVLMLALSLVPAAVAEAKEPVHLVTISAGSKPARRLRRGHGSCQCLLR